MLIKKGDMASILAILNQVSPLICNVDRDTLSVFVNWVYISKPDGPTVGRVVSQSGVKVFDIHFCKITRCRR